MIGEKKKVDNQAITEGGKDRMPETLNFDELVRADKDRNVVTVNINMGGSATVPPPK